MRFRRELLVVLRSIVGVIALVGGFGHSAIAQRTGLPTGNAVPQGSPIPRIRPPAPPSVSPAAPGLTAPVAPNATPNASTSVRSVAVEGATAYPAARLSPLTAGLIGRAVPLAKIEAARAALLSLYREDGYTFTTVNAVVGPSGDLRFTVIEGYIADVKLDGDIGPAGVQVLRFLRHLTDRRPLDSDTLERWLLLAQDVPGVSLHALLRPSTTDPGALTLVAQVDRQAFNGLLTIDNRASRQTGPEQGLLVIGANSFTQFGERTEASIYHTAGSAQNFGQASTDFFIGGSGLHVRLYGGYGEANPSGFLRAIGYEGFTTTFGASASYPLIRQRRQTLNLVATLEAVDTEVRTTLNPGGTSQKASNDQLRIGRLGADYALNDILLGEARPAVNFAGFRISQGLPGLGGTSNNNATPGRVNERVDFTKAAFELTRTQTLFTPYPGSSVALRARVLGQGSSNVLPPSEKFFLGGSEINRGYYSGEATGDNALDGSIELQFNTGFDVTAFGHRLPISTQFYAFYDYGQTWENQRIDPNVHLSSEGIGVRANITRYTEFDLEGVIRNTRQVSGASGVVKPLDSEAIFWRVLTRF